ncbi:Centromere-associated protein E [Heterocephalus glaber]|uniref:Centromere-associated protein E n=1 Tax=Heterocephalus glaber TaxID=10181 RepID=G5BXB1_HETGA|nr:Centromere-associated protein E [Heterocephalus glaber]
MAEEAAVAVCVRVRPLSSREEELGEATQIYWKTDNNAIYQVDGSKSFNFDRVFHSNETTKNVYEEIAVPIIDSAIQGYNGTIFAYGQTASGKTHTMMGLEDCLGVIPRAIHDIFQKIKKILESREKGEPSNCDGSIKVSHLNLVDLAGSERAAQTGAEGVRLKEGCNINRSLFILGQVIKKLSDGQIGGFINYRDSKLTRILQNSLGGNAKTRIICTITPVSFDETLTTLQFASTAKYMKNTPYVNEVSSDEALLKRYRKEIVDLKKQLEEVNIKTRAQEMEKDQLAQLLDEKDSLQKVQDEKIQNLTRMLVTSSSLTSQQELKENLESEFNSLLAKYDNLVLDYEQLRRENEEMGLKLKEKNDLDEFEALERKTEKDQEVQLIHEISNLKNLVKHAEVYNQDLENELSSKVELLREKEAQIKNLQKYIDSQKAEKAPSALPFSSENSEDPKQMRQSFFDAETVALDAKRESAFLRSENLELKEKMKELANSCKQMEIDTQLYQSQLEAKKKIQVDLEKELQSAFNEITKLTSLVDGKLPKDLLCNLELERRITDLQKELNKEVKENKALQKQVSLLSELKSLPSEVEMLRKEIRDTSEELSVITSEKDRLCSEVTQKESSIQGLLEEIGKTKDDLAAAQLNYKSTERAFQDFRILPMALEQKYKTLHEENERMNQEMGDLSKEAEHLRLSLDSVKTELSHNTQEFQQKTAEGQERVCEVEQLKEELERRDAQLRAAEEQKTLVTERLQQSLEAVRSLGQEKEALSQLRDSLQAERDQLCSDIQDTVSMNIDTQEQLRNTLESLRQHQEMINTLKRRLSEETSRNLHAEENVRETEHEFHQEMIGIDEKQNVEAKTTGTLIAGMKDSEVVEQQKKICSLIQEKNEFQQMLESITAEKEQLKTDLKENIEMTIENQEELRILGDELKRQQEIVAQEKNHAIKKDEELARTCERLAEVEEKLKEKSEQLQEKQQQLLNTQEEMSEIQKKMNEMEKLKSEIQNQESRLEHLEMERLELIQKLHENCEEMKSITKERNDLKELRESFEVERDHLKEYISKIEAVGRHTEEELSVAHLHLKEHQKTIAELRSSIAEKEAQIGNAQEDLEKSTTEVEEQVPVPHEEQKPFPTMKAGGEIQDAVRGLEPLGEQSTAEGLTEAERLRLMEELQESQEEIKCLTQERDDLKIVKEALEVERDHLKEYIRETSVKKPSVLVHNGYMRHRSPSEPSACAVSLATNCVFYDSLKIQEAQDKQEQPFHVGEKDKSTGVGEVEQLQEQPEAKDAMLLRAEMEKRQLSQRLEESRGQVSSLAKERDDLQRRQEALQAERDQLTARVREVSEKHQETEAELRVAHCCLKEREETIDELRVNLLEKETEIAGVQKELEAASEALQTKIQELYEKKEQLIRVKEISEMHEKIHELEKFKELLRAKDSTLQGIERDRLELSKRLEESQEEIKIIIRERDELQKLQEALQTERDQLKENLNETAAKLRELGEEQQCLRVKATSETLEAGRELERLREQLEAQRSTLENTEMEKRKLAQRLHENLEEMRAVTQERDNLRSVQETLTVDSERLAGNLEEALARDLETQEKVRIAHLCLKEQQETIDELRGVVSEKTDEVSNMRADLQSTDTALKAQAQEHEKKQHQLLQVENNLKETVFQMEQLKKQFEAQNATLESIEGERLRLTQKLEENLEEVQFLTEENESLRGVEETLREEGEQLRERLRRTEAEALQRQEELRVAHVSLKEQRETTDELRRLVSEKTEEMSNMKMDLETSSVKLQEKIGELKANEHLLVKLKEDVGETQKQLKDQSLMLSKMEMENLNLAQKLHENLEKMKSVAKERDGLRSMEEALMLERDRLREELREAAARGLETQQELKTAHQHLKEQQETIEKFRERVSEKTAQISNIQKALDQSKDELQEKDHQPHREARNSGRRSPCGGEQPLARSLKEKGLRIGELLKSYSELDNHYESLNRLSLDLEKEIETQKELSTRVKANLSPQHPQSKQVQRLLTASQRCSMEFHRVMRKLKYVLSHVTKIKEEQHESINKLEMALVGEVEKQGELRDRLQRAFDGPRTESRLHRLHRLMDLHTEEILKDLSENEFSSIKIEFQQILRNRKEMTRFLEEWLSTHFDIEKLKNGIQKENESIGQVNNFYNNKITAIINESTEFEERSAARCREWEQDLESAREESRALLRDCQVLAASLLSAHGDPASVTLLASESPQVPPGAAQLATQKIQDLESSLHKAKESAVCKEDEIRRIQKELEMSSDVNAKLQAKVNESNKFLEKTNAMIQALQDEVALGAKPYKEEIEDLKTKLVRSDLEKMQTAKEFEKEIISAKATVDHQREVIRLLRENLRRTQQAQDTSMIVEPGDPQPPQKPLTCGGGSGIVQSTKALILKSEYLRLEKELAKLKQQNEQLVQQKGELLSNNQQLCSELKAWKERARKREAPQEVSCEALPKSPVRAPRTGTTRRPSAPAQCRERNLQDPAPLDSPRSRFFDPRSKSFPAPRPAHYFDNSSLGLCPEEQAVGTENVDPEFLPSAALRDAPECRMQ